MSNRAELVAHWQDQLATAESLLETDACRLRWLWRMRTRLYRFLLSCYGGGSWEPECEILPESGNARPTLIDNTASLTGLQPKSPERIRATLKNVRSANDRNDEQGPYTNGLKNEDWIRVAALRHAIDCNKLLRSLDLAEIRVRRGRQGRWLVVEVRRFDYDAAAEIAGELRRQAAAGSRGLSAARPITRWHSFSVSLLIMGMLLISSIFPILLVVRFNSDDSPELSLPTSIENWCLLGGFAVWFFYSVWAVERLVREFLTRPSSQSETP